MPELIALVTVLSLTFIAVVVVHRAMDESVQQGPKEVHHIRFLRHFLGTEEVFSRRLAWWNRD